MGNTLEKKNNLPNWQTAKQKRIVQVFRKYPGLRQHLKLNLVGCLTGSAKGHSCKHWRSRPCSGKPGTGIPWPLMEWAPQGVHSSAHETPPVDSHCVPSGPLARLWDSAPLSLGTRHSGLLGAPCGGPVAFPMGSRNAHCGTPKGAH